MASFASNQKRQIGILAIGCMLLVYIVRPWQLYFLNDDFIHIPTGNLFVRGGFLRPMPNLLVAVDKFLYGKSAFGFFITSLLLHFSCVFILFHLAKSIVNNYFPFLANTLFPLITAMLFLFYPWHAEPLMWLISRVSIMCSILSYASLLYYINASRSPKSFGISWLLFVLALFTYESMWNLVFVFACIGMANKKFRLSSWQQELWPFGVMLGTFLAYLALRVWALDTVAGDGYDEINDNLSRFGFILINLVKLTGRHFTPPFINSNFSLVFFALSVLFYAFCVYKLFKKNRSMGILAIVLLLCMVSGVVTASALGIDTHFNESERYLYYSSGYFCLFLAVLVTVLLAQRIQLIVLITACLVFSILLVLLQRNYAIASSVATQTLKLTGQNPTYKRAYFVDVPTRYNGAVLFRTGLKDAIHWITPQCSYDSVIILSRTENPAFETPYAIGSKSWSAFAESKGWQRNAPIVLDSTHNNITLDTADVLFWFTPQGIYKVAYP